MKDSIFILGVLFQLIFFATCVSVISVLTRLILSLQTFSSRFCRSDSLIRSAWDLIKTFVWNIIFRHKEQSNYNNSINLNMLPFLKARINFLISLSFYVLILALVIPSFQIVKADPFDLSQEVVSVFQFSDRK